MEQLVLIFERVWMCVCVRTCVCIRSLELISTNGIEPCNADLHPVRKVFLIWLGRKGSRKTYLFLDVSFPPQVYTCCSSYLWNIHPLLCLKLCTPLLEYFIRKPAVTKYISAVLWILLFLSFCSLQRKWMRILEFLIMRKPLQLFTFRESSRFLSGLHVHIPHISSAHCACSIKWNLWIKHDYLNTYGRNYKLIWKATKSIKTVTLIMSLRKDTIKLSF